MRIYLVICIILLTMGYMSAQIAVIDGVPDFSQSPFHIVPSTQDTTNYCAPFAALNIIAYWEFTRTHPFVFGLMAGLPAEEVAEYLGWFTDTNNNGNPVRANGTIYYPGIGAKGTINIDQDPGLLDYITMDALNPQVFIITG